MISVKTSAYVSLDGTLRVEVPTPLRGTYVEVMLVVQPVPTREPSPSSAALTPEELGWPPGFFERTFGSLRNDPLERLPQGEYEEREAIE